MSTIELGMKELTDALDAEARRAGFSGVVRVDRRGAVEVARAYGMSDRRHRVANTVGTRFGIASGTKGLTALAVVSLVEAGSLTLATSVRSLLGDDLPLVGDDVTVELLLAHRSGIGDYLDEDEPHDVDDHVMKVSVHRLDATEDYLCVLDGHNTKFPAGTGFAYCNSGYVLLALIAERATGIPFHELVRQRVCEPAGMADTAFLRSDDLPADAATGYLAGGGSRTNVLHLPVRGSGDGGIYSTAADVSSLWSALDAGRIVSAQWVGEMLRPRSAVPGGAREYGLGFWLRDGGEIAMLEGSDAGVSFRTSHRRVDGATWTVLSNTSDGAWPIVRLLDAHVRGQRL